MTKKMPTHFTPGTPLPTKKKKNCQAPTPDFFLDSRMESMSKFIFSVKDLLLNQHYNN